MRLGRLRRRSSHALLGFLVGVALVGGEARASTGYPAEMQSELPLTYTPACALCHGTDVDAGTGYSTKFGTDIGNYGLVGGNNLASLDGALEGMVGSMDPLIADVKDGIDPNGSTATNSIPDIAYGCFNVTGQGPTGGMAGLLLVGLVLLVLVRPWRRAR